MISKAEIWMFPIVPKRYKNINVSLALTMAQVKYEILNISYFHINNPMLEDGLSWALSSTACLSSRKQAPVLFYDQAEILFSWRACSEGEGGVSGYAGSGGGKASVSTYSPVLVETQCGKAKCRVLQIQLTSLNGFLPSK